MLPWQQVIFHLLENITLVQERKSFHFIKFVLISSQKKNKIKFVLIFYRLKELVLLIKNLPIILGLSVNRFTRS